MGIIMELSGHFKRLEESWVVISGMAIGHHAFSFTGGDLAKVSSRVHSSFEAFLHEVIIELGGRALNSL